MTDLGDFGVEREEPHPRLRRKSPRYSPHTGKICGFICRELDRGNDALVYATRRIKKYHWYRKGGGWAVSESIIDDCESLDVTRIFVHGKHPDDPVYEYDARDYYDGENIPPEDLYDEDDPQVYPPGDPYMNEYPGYSFAMFTQSFRAACRRLGDEGRLR